MLESPHWAGSSQQLHANRHTVKCSTAGHCMQCRSTFTAEVQISWLSDLGGPASRQSFGTPRSRDEVKNVHPSSNCRKPMRDGKCETGHAFSLLAALSVSASFSSGVWIEAARSHLHIRKSTSCNFWAVASWIVVARAQSISLQYN